jgi:DNA-binding transcriptional regulator LsrR (DeoR family)
MPARKGSTTKEEASPVDQQVRAAWLYYVQGLTQLQISRVLDMSRARIIRLLATARDSGVVRISIEGRGSDQIALERALIDRYRLDEAVVVPAAASEAGIATVVGHAAGMYLSENVHDGMSIGVGWGTTLDMSLKSIAAAPRKRLSVVSLLGQMTHSRAVNPSAVARRIADAFGADCYQLTAPVFVANKALRMTLWTEPGLRDLRERARRIDMALVSVGDVSEQATLFREGLLPPSQVASLLKGGAVGDVLCQFIDATGRVLDHPVNRRAMAVDLQALARVPRIVIAAGGRRKVGPIRGALKALPASVLITDTGAARGLLSS